MQQQVSVKENKTSLTSLIKDTPYFLQENFALYYGDCLKVLEQIPTNSVDMIFADPPYNLSNDGFTVHAGRMVSVNKGEWDRSRGFQDDYNFHYLPLHKLGLPMPKI